jgi:hypothetical protein
MRYLCWEYCIDFAYFYYFAIRFWKCSDCGIICFLFDNYLLITLNQRNVQLPIQSVPITIDVASSNIDQGEVYNIM